MVRAIPDAKTIEYRERFVAHMRRYHPRSVTAQLADELDAIREALGGYPDSDLPSLAAAVRRAADLFDQQYQCHCAQCRDSECAGFPWGAK